jgi:antitoxin component of MazEF toxin-antitoxin module
MANKKSNEKNVRKLTKIGKHSIGLTLPIEVVRELGWRERQKVSVKVERRKIISSDWRK